MIDWETLTRTDNVEQNHQNAGKCRNKEGAVGTDLALCRNDESKHSCGSTNSVPTVPTVPTQKTGDGKGNKENVSGEAGASDNFSDAKIHPVNPIAVCLLLTYCNKATVDKEETIEQILKLQFIPQPEQIRSWAILCHRHGIDPYRVIYPFTKSSSKGMSCKGCKHIDMKLIPNEDARPTYRFTCAKHHGMLEAYYVGERVLVAPEACKDYEPSSHPKYGT